MSNMFVVEKDPYYPGMKLVFIGEEPNNDHEAIDISIEKWTLLAQQEVPTNDMGDKTCGLCMLHIIKDCEGCPIFEKTGQAYCQGTPYFDYINAHNQYASGNLDYEPALYLLKQHAQEELEFLQEIKNEYQTTD
jgi:hypothetical protein